MKPIIYLYTRTHSIFFIDDYSYRKTFRNSFHILMTLKTLQVIFQKKNPNDFIIRHKPTTIPKITSRTMNIESGTFQETGIRKWPTNAPTNTLYNFRSRFPFRKPALTFRRVKGESEPNERGPSYDRKGSVAILKWREARIRDITLRARI